MAIRNLLNRNPAVTAAVIVVGICLIIAATWWQMRELTPSKPGAYFTTDDGESYFRDDPEKVTPFEYKGKQAVRAHVFRGGDGKEFVGYLSRHTPQAAEVIRKVRARKPTDPPPTMAEMGVAQGGRELKRPGDKGWVPLRDPAAAKITAVTSPDGSPAVEIE